jgi:GT2 family glycosyltransferase
MKIDIIIPCYLLPDKDHELLWFTKRCVQSIRENVKNANVIIVDNGSWCDKDYLYGMADVYIELSENKGYAGGVNKGLELASHSWVLVANNDIVIMPNCIDEMIGAWKSSTGAMSPHLEIAPAMDTSCFGMCGALWMSRLDIIREVGYLDEGYGIGYYEDRDYWKRMECAGYGLRKAGQIWHQGNATSGKIPGLDIIMKENERRFKEKWGE